MKLHIETPGTVFMPEYEYVCHTVFEEFLGIPVHISPGESACWRIHAPSGNLDLPNDFFPENKPEDFFSNARIPDVSNEITVLKTRYTALYANPALGDAALDIMGTIFFLLTSFEDQLELPHDQYGLLRSDVTWLGRNQLFYRPIVDELLDLLEILLRRFAVNMPPRMRDYTFTYSCDVDSPTLWHDLPFKLYMRGLAGSLIKRRSTSEFACRLAARFSVSRDPYFSFQWICERLEEIGITGCFNFKAGASNSFYDAPYSLASPHIKNLLSMLVQHGHEIGFHPSYAAADNPNLFPSELKELRKASPVPVNGGRHHYLRFKGAHTWRMWEHAGLKYDASVGFNDSPGFRCGTAREFPVFDLLARQSLSLRERPLVAMEGTLLNILHYNSAQTFDAIVSLGNTVKHYGGNMSLLWHNSSLINAEERDLFCSTLKALC